ncbi:hypothetical protein B0T25DRAFT_562781 [Lasiosphaeria hispida]|uniref:Uncharacterized protein n=1 Tax=Lasiosphaeria hispida TaxID=260671 RepID=A0AAJ0MKP9_9PEZI|nr:hypothetical protein B0T25DRAFT_562781 [Lasiosphaeria hispida]
MPDSPISKKRRLPFKRTAIPFEARRKPRPGWFIQYKRAFGRTRRHFDVSCWEPCDLVWAEKCVTHVPAPGGKGILADSELRRLHGQERCSCFAKNYGGDLHRWSGVTNPLSGGADEPKAAEWKPPAGRFTEIMASHDEALRWADEPKAAEWEPPAGRFTEIMESHGEALRWAGEAEEGFETVRRQLRRLISFWEGEGIFDKDPDVKPELLAFQGSAANNRLAAATLLDFIRAMLPDEWNEVHMAAFRTLRLSEIDASLKGGHGGDLTLWRKAKPDV